jgi:DNA-binding winged helix-turn-helix (wHTH) protein
LRLQFGDCVVDFDTRELFRSGRPAHVQPKVFRLLELLLEARPTALSKDTLQDAIWPKTFVSERSLARTVVALRVAVGDRARDPRFVRTVYGFGYAFCGEAAAMPSRAPEARRAAAQCRLRWGDRQIVLSEGENVLGRDPDAAVCIDLASVSRRHARITVRDGAATLEDLGSRNGTTLRGERISGPVPLARGDIIRIGSARLVFRSYSKTGTTASKVTET